ncbi:MAG: hypothetical protein ACRD2T_04100 [Thermoanaerobaculia bacterium]
MNGEARLTVFTADFLDRLEKSDEPGSVGEAEWSGDWKVVSLAPDRHLVLRGWQEPANDQPAAILTERSAALLCAAVLPLEARPRLFIVRPVRAEGRYDVLVQDSYDPARPCQPIGEVRDFSEAQALALHLAGCFARSPHALALLLEAAGPTAIQMAGEILHRRLV